MNALLTCRSGATGVLQAGTAFWPGYQERIELHGTEGTAVLSGDHLVRWDVLNDEAAAAIDPAPVTVPGVSGSSDPMAISVLSFERQLQDFASAIRDKKSPAVDGQAGLNALQAVQAIYRSCRERRFVQLTD